MTKLTEEQQELVNKAYEILAQNEVTEKLTIGFPLPPKKPSIE